MGFFKKFSNSMSMSKKMADMKAQFPEIWQIAEGHAEVYYKLFCETKKDEKSFEKWLKSLPNKKDWIYEYVTQVALPTAVEEFGGNLATSAGQPIAVDNQVLEAFSTAYGTKLINLLKNYNGIREDKYSKFGMEANERQRISLEELAFALIDVKFKSDHLTKGFKDLCKGVEVKDGKLSDKHFLEYLIFDLFTDNACFLLAFKREISLELFKIYYVNIVVRLSAKGYKVEGEEFEELFEKRAIEYHQYLQEYSSEYIEKMNVYTYLPGLGKAFSINFVAYEDPIIIYKVHFDFVLKLKHFYKGYLKDIAENNEIVL